MSINEWCVLSTYLFRTDLLHHFINAKSWWSLDVLVMSVMSCAKRRKETSFSLLRSSFALGNKQAAWELPGFFLHGCVSRKKMRQNQSTALISRCYFGGEGASSFNLFINLCVCSVGSEGDLRYELTPF